jgi:hypothetical protein
MIEEGRLKLYNQLYDFLHSKLYEIFNTEKFDVTLLGYWKQYEDYALKYKHILKNDAVAIDEIENILCEAAKVKDRFQQYSLHFEESFRQMIKENRHFLYVRVRLRKFNFQEISKKQLSVRFYFDFTGKIKAKNLFLLYATSLVTCIEKAEALKRQLQVKADLTQKPTGETKEAKPTYKQYALYYYYMQKASLIDRFEYWPDGIVPAYMEVCRQHQFTAKTSWRIFQREFTLIQNEGDRKKLGKRHYNKLVELLKGSPAAITEVNKELKPIQG